MDRAHALLVRSIPISVVLLVLTIGIAWRFEFEAAWVMVTWGVLCAITYLLFDRQEQDYSTNGLERHRIDKAFQLRREEIRHDHELKKMALEAHLLAVKTYYGTPENDSDEN
jgi:sensor domain CHASE-containing protein